LPAPLSQKRNEDVLDVVIGTNIYGGEETPVGLTSEQRHQHTYIVGKTGMGKSTIIAGMALQDMAKGKGLAVIDPHGDFI
jgi:type IV secretory pathway VirB4 component